MTPQSYKEADREKEEGKRGLHCIRITEKEKIRIGEKEEKRKGKRNKIDQEVEDHCRVKEGIIAVCIYLTSKLCFFWRIRSSEGSEIQSNPTNSNTRSMQPTLPGAEYEYATNVQISWDSNRKIKTE